MPFAACNTTISRPFTRAIGIAWKADVLGYPTLALVAAMARRSHPGPVTVAMTGGHGEWFVQDFGADGLPEEDLASLPPNEAARHGKHQVVAGSQAKNKSELARQRYIALDILPDAREFLMVPETLLTAELAPLYGRPPDARLPAGVR